MDDQEAHALDVLRRRLDRTVAGVVIGTGILAVCVGVTLYVVLARLQMDAWGGHSVYLTATVAAVAGMFILWRGTTALLTNVLRRFAWGWSESIAARHRMSKERLDALLELRNVSR